MASELRVNTLKDAAGNNSVAMQYVANGSAKAWASVDQTSTGHPVYDSFNVSATADVAAGTTKVSFSNAMNNANYSLAGVGQTKGYAGTNLGLWGKSTTSSNQMTTTDFHTRNINVSGVDTDTQYFGFVAHGDLA